MLHYVHQLVTNFACLMFSCWEGKVERVYLSCLLHPETRLMREARLNQSCKVADARKLCRAEGDLGVVTHNTFLYVALQRRLSASLEKRKSSISRYNVYHVHHLSQVQLRLVGMSLVLHEPKY